MNHDDRSRELGPGEVLADRVHKFSIPRWFMYAALTKDRLTWLRLQPGEVEPEVVLAVPEDRVIWSSFWPVSPTDTIVFDLAGDRESSVRFRWFSESPPDERGIAITRQRLNLKFGSDIRSRTAEYTWGTWDQDDDLPRGPFRRPHPASGRSDYGVTVSAEKLLAQLREFVALLALSAPDQERWLATNRFPVDELALQLADGIFGFVPRLESEGFVNSAVLQHLSSISVALTEISGPANARLWTETGLYNAPEWRAIRALAASALVEIDRFGPGSERFR